MAVCHAGLNLLRAARASLQPHRADMKMCAGQAARLAGGRAASACCQHGPAGRPSSHLLRQLADCTARPDCSHTARQ